MQLRAKEVGTGWLYASTAAPTRPLQTRAQRCFKNLTTRALVLYVLTNAVRRGGCVGACG